MNRRLAGAAWCALSLAFPFVAAAAVPDPLQVPWAGDSALLVAGEEGSPELRFPGGRALALGAALPAGAQLTALAVAGDGWVAAGTAPSADGGRELVLLSGGEERFRRFAAPGAGGSLVSEPVPLVEGDRLVGLAWLEGEAQNRLAVVAAARKGKGWKHPEKVAPPGPGSQLALAGAVLADGTWLLAWSAFDGRDDEVVWSRRFGRGEWSRAARVSPDNAVPDVTPALAAWGEGALLAWSRFDGASYRLTTARFAGDGFSDERAADTAGTIFPSFVRGSGLRLVYRDARQGAWAVDEVAADGSRRRLATEVTARRERPVVVEGAGGTVTLRQAAEAAP